jgi:hypothetical protein
MSVNTLLPQKSHSLDSVRSHVQMDFLIGFAKSFLRQPDITGTVFDKKNFYGHTISSDELHDCFSLSARAK